MEDREYKYCEVCGKYPQKHHCIFKSESKLMINTPINYKYLCNEHHNGDNGPHHNKSVDDIYKREVQGKLQELFCEKFYSEKQIKELLQISKSETRKIAKHLVQYKNGYLGIEIIFHLLGDRWF